MEVLNSQENTNCHTVMIENIEDFNGWVVSWVIGKEQCPVARFGLVPVPKILLHTVHLRFLSRWRQQWRWLLSQWCVVAYYAGGVGSDLSSCSAFTVLPSLSSFVCMFYLIQHFAMTIPPYQLAGCGSATNKSFSAELCGVY